MTAPVPVEQSWIWVKWTHNKLWQNTIRCVKHEYNTLRSWQNGTHLADIFKWIFLNENIWISIKISLKFVPRGSINITALVQIMAWRRPGNKPLSEPVMVILLPYIYIYITHPQWVNRRLWYQKQVSQGGISNCISQYSVGCNHLSMPEIPASGTKVFNS